MSRLEIVQQGMAFVIVIAALFGFFWSWVRILNRMGLSGWWILLMGAWPIMLPILATCRWPAFEKPDGNSEDANLIQVQVRPELPA